MQLMEAKFGLTMFGRYLLVAINQSFSILFHDNQESCMKRVLIFIDYHNMTQTNPDCFRYF